MTDPAPTAGASGRARGGWLRAGAVGAAHGLDGSFRVHEPSGELLVLGTAVLVGDRERAIERRAGYERRLILRLEGCEDRSAAQSLRGAELFVSRSDAPELGADEWWAEDLQGCVVYGREDAGSRAKRVLGEVRRLIVLPSCEALEVARADGSPDLLVPLVSDAVHGVDLERREIHVDLRFLGEG
ncbi:MAG: ribosome maturation factor RimM [Solirubrobacteraceae bacterium]